MLRILKNYILREIPKTRLMDFGLLYENDKGEYVVLNDIRTADIPLAYLVYASTYCVPTALLRRNKPFRLLYLGHAQIVKGVELSSRRAQFIYDRNYNRIPGEEVKLARPSIFLVTTS